MITKERKNQLVAWANDVIQDGGGLVYNNNTINKSYNGQIAGFSVSVAMSGLKPALALYMSGSSSSDVDKSAIVGLLAKMYNKEYGGNKDKDALYKMVINESDSDKINVYREKIVEYAIALKLAVRTFKLV